MRADKFFSDRFGSRTRAAQALGRGLVLRGGKPLSASDSVCEDDEFLFLEPKESFVSNGGYKLARGLDVFGQEVVGRVFADLGASKGGFTDCLLQRGAALVFCVDVGESQLDSRLRSDARVRVMDGKNARYLCPKEFPCSLDGVVADLSFISLSLVLPAVSALLSEGGRAFLLFKPQFECGSGKIGKSGILPVSKHAKLLSCFYDEAVQCGLAPQDVVNAPLREKKNTEYVIFLKKGARPIGKAEFLSHAAAFFETRGTESGTDR